jgi:hypothetical protein
MNKIYIVTGSTWDGGEGCTSWDVKAFKTKWLAEELKQECQHVANEFMIQNATYNQMMDRFDQEIRYPYFEIPHKLGEVVIPDFVDEMQYKLYELSPDEREYRYVDPNFQHYGEMTKYYVEELGLDECPTDGMITKKSHYCHDCSGGE